MQSVLIGSLIFYIGEINAVIEYEPATRFMLVCYGQSEYHSMTYAAAQINQMLFESDMPCTKTKTKIYILVCCIYFYLPESKLTTVHLKTTTLKPTKISE